MKYFVLACALLYLTPANLEAQVKLPALDKSPMDISYYPGNYPLLKIQDKASEPLLARIIYSRPQKNGRVIFGDLIEYGKVWRLGANEATEIEFFQTVKIGNQKDEERPLYLVRDPRYRQMDHHCKFRDRYLGLIQV